MTTEPHGSEKDAVRQQLYELLDDTERSLVTKQRRGLELGCEYLGVANGHIQRRNDDGTDDVIASVGSNPELFPEGMVLDRARTYCRRTVESHSPLALSNASEQGWATDPAYEKHGLDCYLGTTIFVDGAIYGTVCFTAEAPRQSDFTADEKAFVELIARLLGRTIEAEANERRVERLDRSRRRSEAKYEALLRLAPDAIVVVDTDTGTIETANERAASLTGYSEAELRGLSILELHPEADRQRYARLFDEGFDDRVQERFDDGTPLVIERADGTTVPIELGVGRVELDDHSVILGIVRDVSERKERERELRLKEQAIEESSIGITIGDATKPDTPIVYANAGFEALTGYSMGELNGENCRFLQGDETDTETVAEIRRAIDAEESIRTEILNYRANGRPFWNELTVAPVMNPESRAVTHFVGIQNDVTARKRRNRLIEVLDRVLRHNLRNDMNVVIGFSETIAARTDGELTEMASRVTETAQDLISLSNTVRGFESGVVDATQPELRDIRTVIDAAVEDLRSDYPDTEFTVLAAESMTVLATSKLSLALAELGDNAAKYGESSVRYEQTTTDDGRIAVHVHDDGPGLPAIERNVLEAGRETPLEHGSGLGLWMVNWIVTNLGGSVTASVDDGTTVSIYLPTPAATEMDDVQSQSVSDRQRGGPL
ncbi:MAG: PAS domain S-box protein [Euryarchaeota archaeon]|nr:PAS domain S-box protein [Euryarchaeota archaeon]